MKSINFLAECFVALDKEEKIEITEVTEQPFFYQVRVKNVSSTVSTLPGLQKFFGNLPVRCTNVPNSNCIDIHVSKVKMPNQPYGLKDFARFMDGELTSKHKDHWFLGLSDFGPHFFDLKRLTHLGLFGASGFGKSSLFRMMLSQTLKYHHNTVNFIIDPKKVDYSSFQKHKSVKAVAKTYAEWSSLITSLVVECSFREKVFAQAFESSPTTLDEYASLRQKYGRKELPDFPRMILWVDEAHVVFHEAADSPAYNGLTHLARKARSFGIHLVISSQRYSDVPSVIRTQLAQTFNFFTTENHLTSDLQFPVEKMMAVPGRLYYVDSENRSFSSVQCPYLNNDEAVGISYSTHNPKSFRPVSALKLPREWLNNGCVINYLAGGFALDELAALDPAKIKDFKGFRKIHEFNFEYENWYEELLEQALPPTEPQAANAVKASSKPAISLEETDNLMKEFDALMAELAQKPGTKAAPIAAAVAEKEIPLKLLAKNPATVPAKKPSLIPQFETTNNFPQSQLLVKRFNEFLLSSLNHFNWCLQNIDSNPGLQAAQYALRGVFDRRDYIHTVSQLALGEKQKSLLQSYETMLSLALLEKTKAPLLMVTSKEGFGKQTLIETLCKHAGLPIRPGKLSELTQLQAQDEKAEPQAYVFDDPEEALEFYKHVGKNEVVFVSYTEVEHNPFAFFMVQAPYDFTYVKENHILLRLDERMYSEPDVFEKLIQSVLQKHGYKGSEKGLMKLFATSGVKAIPSQIEAVVSRASTRARYAQTKFDETLLQETLQFLELSKDIESHEVQIITPQKSRQDLILHEDTDRDVVDVIFRARNLERSPYKFMRKLRKNPRMVALFSGDPGTGKTMAAEVVAAEVQKDLWLCDFSKILGSLLGQTEKTLTRIFNSARAAGAVLLLDECDALLSNRSEASKDQRAIVNHLLMLIENYSGILIMTTNFADHLDPAFSRRIDIKAAFKLPAEKQMAEILNRLLQPDAPLSPDYDAEKIVKGFKLSGGLIRNAVERAFIGMQRTQSKFLTNELLRKGLEDTHQENVLMIKEERKMGIAS